MPRTSMAAATGALILASLIAPLAATPAGAQPADRMWRPPVESRPGELGFFSEPNYRGRSYFVTGPRENLSIPFQPRSMQVSRGDAWTLCARRAYRAPCVDVRDSNPNGGPRLSAIASARPAGGGGGGGGGGDFSGTGPAGPALAGMASEFFRSPEDRGRRVVACPGRPAAAACAADTAGRFCQARGYRGGSAYQLLETVRGEVYLADVLCKRAH